MRILVLVLFTLLSSSTLAVSGVDVDHDDGTKHNDETTTAALLVGDLSPPSSSRFNLNDKETMPMVGLGVAESETATYQSIRWALQAGYRLVDTASHESYGNEDQVGAAIRDAIVAAAAEAAATADAATSKTNDTTTSGSSRLFSRQDVWVTTKLWDEDHGFHETLEAFEESLEELGLDYVDLYLIHSPFGGYLVETWDALIYLQQQQQQQQQSTTTKRTVVKSIGVANFGIPHLEAISLGGRPLPAVNQIEIHPLLYQQRKPLLDWCQQRGIQIQAFGSMLYGSFQKWADQEPLKSVLANHPQKTGAQVLLRWAIQHSIAVIPKSTKQARIQENIDIFDFTLNAEDMASLDNWGTTLSPEDRLLYKEDWNWNPIDEAPVHLGKTDWWPDFEFEVEEEEEEEEDEDDLEEEL